MQHKCFFQVTVLTILFVFFCFQDGWAEKTWWSKKYKDKKVECSVDYPGLIPGLISLVWNNFSVTYTTRAKGEQYSWTYNCGKQAPSRSIHDCSHSCSLIDDDNVSSLSLPSDFDPDSSVEVDLKPGTLNAQEKVCREIFNKSNP